MKPPANDAYQQLCRHVRQAEMLASIEALLGWDERTMLPPAAAEYRAEQVAGLSGLIHERRTAPEVGHWLEQLSSGDWAEQASEDERATVRELRRQYQRQVRLPQSLVEELARTSVQGQQVWVEARRTNDFARFRPLLERTLRLKREQAEALGYEECLYDALLEDYEPGARTSQVARILGALRDELRPLVAGLAESAGRPRKEILARSFPVAAQEAFSREAAAAIGFDFQRGRLDVTAHPFCTRLGPDDCRITTRYNERAFAEAFFGTLHESGHGIYEQGLRTDQFGLPPGSAASLGVHESQSRMWENLVGRSRGFWQYFYPAAQRHFPAALSDVSLDEFVFCINGVEPSLIRIEADEATYNLHIIIRFELEQELLNDTLRVGDLPAAWNAKYEANLGIRPADDAHGVLQDIHWSAGLFGYFATYSLGNLFAAQLFEAAERDLGKLEEQFAAGRFDPLREWLTERVYRRGHCLPASQLMESVIGRPISHQQLISHLRRKLGPLYGI
ncbi:MAG: carboxypeptidase M32 [Pirellulaceae bacterium]|nr:carboxypeptidase M32 [Pirellulaceae bacterium]